MRRLSWIALFAAACSASSSESTESSNLAEGPVLALHDVAVLFPLPAPGQTAALWSASHVLPEAIVDHLGPLVAGEPNRATYASLRVVSLRLEPCFVVDTSSACERQIRFVLQPVSVDPQGASSGIDHGPAAGDAPSTTTIDAAVHVIYALPTRTFAELVSGVVALRSASAPTSPAPLGVHPVLATEGLDGPFARGLLPLVLASTAQGHLARVTFMGLRGRGNEWQLGGVQVAEDGAVTPLPIPSSGARLQSIVLQRSAQTFVKSVSPQTAGTDDVSLLLDSLSASAAPPAEISAALRAANRIENPDVRSSENTDCATCHTVGSSRLWAEKTFAVRETADRFAAPGFDLEAKSPPVSDLGVLRALGYFGSEPVISPRAIHDTAKAAQTIRAGSRGRQ